MTTVKQVQSHITSLINQDKSDGKQVDSFYNQALAIIKTSLQAFFNEYANDTGLDLNTVSQQANSWDMRQFQNAVNLLLQNAKPNDDLQRRLIAAHVTAEGKKKDTINAIVNASLAIATFHTQNYGNKALKQAYIDEFNYRSDDSNQKNTSNLPKDVNTQDDFNNRVWVHGDLAASRTNQTVDKALKKTIDKGSLRQLLKDNHGTPKVGNIDTSAQTGISFNKQLLRACSITNTNKAQQWVYKHDDDTSYLTWVTEHDDKVCDICAPLDGEIYKMSNTPTYPIPQEDTHINCRCSLEPCDEDGNLL